ncbi:MAG: glycerol-3-phosphate 1-O-acyltransferase PlsY [Pseudomonadota bacterium]
MADQFSLIALLAMATGYACGSIPFGLLLTRAFNLGDLRQIGSGNIGATNVLRTGRKDIAAATLILDALKGAAGVLLAVSIARAVFGPLPADADVIAASNPAIAGGLGAMLGHCFPVWLGFRGGKAVATYLGVIFIWSWVAGLGFAAAWLAMAAISRISSLAALTAVLLVPWLVWSAWSLDVLTGPDSPHKAFLWLAHPVAVAGGCALAAILIVWRHRANIGRLLRGEEPRIGQR